MERRLNRRKFFSPEEQSRVHFDDVCARYRNAKLERVLGCTAISSCSLSVDQKTGLVAYPAGSTVVLYSPKTHHQAHLISPTKNNLTCLAFSNDGCYIATGEYGHEPMVRIWELHNRSGQYNSVQVAELKNHKWGVTCVRFTPDGNQLITIGNQHDKSVVVWNWSKGQKIAENRVTSQVNAMDVSENGQIFVTVGVRHVKFWKALASATPGVSTLQGRSAILSEQRNNTFVDVIFAKGNRSFAITETRLLVEFQDKKLVCTYDLHNTAPFALAMGFDQLYIGCENGIVRSLHLEPNVKHAMTLCKPHYLGIDVAKGTTPECFLSAPSDARFPDVRALRMNRLSNTLTVVYNDHSVYQWRTLANGRIEKAASQLFHVGPIFHLEMYPSAASFLPGGTFLTAGADETVRMWNIDLRTGEMPTMESNALSIPQKNLYSEELKKIIYFGASDNSLCEPIEKNLLGATGDGVRVDSTLGLKCLRVSPDGRHLATGGRNGNITVFDLTTASMEKKVEHAAHEGDVLCLEYSDPSKGMHRASLSIKILPVSGAKYLLASGGRDRLVHVFDPLNEYDALTTVDDHSSVINSIKFSMNAGGLEMFTCAADKLVVIRRLSIAPSGLVFERINQISSTVSLNDMAVSPDSTILAACQDRVIRSYSLSGKPLRSMKGSLSDDGNLTKICLDPSGSYAAAVSSDRMVYLIDAGSGECVAVLTGQSDSITSVAFSPDCRRLIVVSYSGCVFIWRLSTMLTNRMLSKVKKISSTNSGTQNTERSRTPDSVIESGSDAASDEYTNTSSSARIKFGRNVVDGQYSAATSTLTTAKDSESEFGSLSSVRIDEDDDSCLGQKPASVVIAQTPDIDNSVFQVKRLPTEVVRRSTSGQIGETLSSWDLHSAANADFSDEDESRGSSSASASRPDSAFPSSRSMSSLRSPFAIDGSGTSPRRQRRKWDNPVAGDVQTTPSTYPYHVQSPVNNQNIASHQQQSTAKPSGFMFMTGNSIYQADNATVKNISPIVPPRSNNQEHSGYPNETGQSRQLPRPSPHIHHVQQNDVFSRTAAPRISLTKRHLNNNGELQQPYHPSPPPRTMWTPNDIAARRTTSNMHSTTPSGAAASAITRRQSEFFPATTTTPTSLPSQSSGRLYFSPASQSESRRLSRSALRIRQQASRRMTVAHMNGVTNGGGNAPEEEYASSDLHMRSRSQSPSQIAVLHETTSLGNIRRPRQDSDLSMASSTMMRSTRLTPASSRSNLRADLTPSSRAAQLNELANIREKLRKSQENLAAPIGDEGGMFASGSGAMSRSKSIGNLRFTAAPQLSESMNVGSSTMQKQFGMNDANTLTTGSRHLARSVGSLHQNDDEQSPEGNLGRDAGGGSRSRLAQTIRELKKASNPDLTNIDQYDEEDGSLEDTGINSYFSAMSLSLPRNARKGAVQKKVEKYQPKYRPRGDASGDSDASDFTSITSNRRYFMSPPASASTPLRTVSSVEAASSFPRPGTLQNTRRIFEPQQRHLTSAISPRRAPNYLAQKMANVDIGGGPDMGNDDSPRTPHLDASILTDFDSKTPQSKQMARHVAECIDELNNGLHRVLQARQMLESSDNLPPDDKDSLLHVLNQSIQNAYKRLGSTAMSGSRMEPEGGRSDSPNNGIHSHRSMGVSSSQHVTSPPQQQLVVDNNFLAQHGHQLMALLQQNMAKQN